MKKKRQLVVNKKFQIRFAALLTAVSALFLAVIIVIIILLFIKNNKKLDYVAQNQQLLTANQKDVFKTLITISRMKSLDNIRISVPDLKKDMKANQERLNENHSIIAEIIKSNNRLIIVLIIFVIIQSLILFYILIKRSLRISGPIYHMSEYIRDITNGKYPKIRPLRNNDEFKEFHELIVKMVDSFRQRQRQRENKS